MKAPVATSRFDHLLLIRRHAIEVARFRSYIARGIAERAAMMPTVLHEADNSCCRREPWSVTMLALLLVDEQAAGG